MKTRIKEFREAGGMNQETLGSAIGVGWQRISSYETKGKVPPGRLTRIAEVLGVPLAALIDDGLTIPVCVKSYVQASHWTDDREWDPVDWRWLFLTDAEDLRGLRLQGAVVRGDSMNRKWPEGSVVVFSPDRTDPLEVGKYYVVQREIDGRYEATVKRLWRDNPEAPYWLAPETDDPTFASFPLKSEGEETIRILGRVVRGIKPE